MSNKVPLSPNPQPLPAMYRLLAIFVLSALRLAIFRWEGEPYRVASCFAVLILATVVVLATDRLRQYSRATADVWLRASALAWWAAAGLALILAPYAIHPERFPLATWLAVAAIGGVAITGVNQHAQSLVASGRRFSLVGWLLLTVALIATLQYFSAVRPHVGSVDWFYYLCYARDMLRQPDEVNPLAYSYFPGVYLFWRASMQVFGDQVATLQLVHLGVVIAVGLLVGVLVYQLTDQRWLATAAPIFYWVWASRFEAFTGVTEPLATLFFLLGLIAFGGEPLRGRAGWQRAIMCGIAWGLCVYCKQQGGLLALGYIVLLVGKVRYRNHDRWLQLLALPASSLVTLLSAIAFEGRGWEPLRQGLMTAASYPSELGFWSNVYVQVRHDESLALVTILCGAVLLWISLQHADHREWPPWLRVLQIAVLGGAMTLVQFERRTYAHYMLLALPSLVLVYLSLCWYCLARLFRRQQFQPLVAWVLLSGALFPLFYTGANPTNLHVWQVMKTDLRALTLWHRRPQVATDLERLSELLKSADQRVFVLPPYRNDVFYLCGVRAPVSRGYGFQLREPDALPWTDMDVVVYVRAELDTHPERARYEAELKPILDALPQRGFVEWWSSPSVVVYQRQEEL